MIRRNPEATSTLLLVTGAPGSGRRDWGRRRARALAGEGALTYLSIAPIGRAPLPAARGARPTQPWQRLSCATGVAARVEANGIGHGEVILLDDLGTLLDNLEARDGGEKRIERQVRLESELHALLGLVEAHAASLVVISDFGVGPSDRWLAAQASELWMTVSGVALPLHDLGRRIDGGTW